MVQKRPAQGGTERPFRCLDLHLFASEPVCTIFGRASICILNCAGRQMFPLPIFSVSLQHNFTISEQVFAEKENYSGDIFKGNAVNKHHIN